MAGAKVFISYVREDAAQALRLYNELKANAFNPWLDTEDLPPGIEWKSAIIEVIEGSQFIVVLLSARSVSKTGFVQREIREAIEQFQERPPGSVFLIPARLESCEPSHRILRSINWVDLFPEWHAGVARLVNTLTNEILKTVEERFDSLHGCMGMFASERKRWIDQNVAYLSQISSPTILDYLENDDHWSILSNELCAIECMVRMAVSYQLESLQSYVFRIHHIVKRLQFPYEWGAGYGLALHAASFVDPRSRVVLLKDLFEDGVSRRESLFGGAPDWDRDLLLAELAKQFSVRAGDSQTSESPDWIVERTARTLGWDIAFLELWTFYLQHTRRYRELLALVPILRHGLLGHSDGSVAFPSPQSSVELSPLEQQELKSCFGFESADRRPEGLYADHRERFSRLGLLLRIGAYLSLEEQADINNYGRVLEDLALAQLEVASPDVHDAISGLSEGDRMRAIRHIEYQDAAGLESLVPPGKISRILSLAKEGCYYYDWETGQHQRVPIKVAGSSMGEV